MESLKNIALASETLIVDVRIPEQYRVGHIEDSVNIPLIEVLDHVDELSKYKHVILVCNVGYQTMIAKEALEREGLHNVIDGKGWLELDNLISTREE